MRMDQLVDLANDTDLYPIANIAYLQGTKGAPMASARDVAQYILEQHGQMTAMKLHKIVNHGGAGPAEKRWDDEANAFAAPRGRERHHMLRAVMPEIGAVEGPEEHAGLSEQSCAPYLCFSCKGRRSVSRNGP